MFDHDYELEKRHHPENFCMCKMVVAPSIAKYEHGYDDLPDDVTDLTHQICVGCGTIYDL